MSEKIVAEFQECAEMKIFLSDFEISDCKAEKYDAYSFEKYCYVSLEYNRVNLC
jgi:hypothetical protein